MAKLCLLTFFTVLSQVLPAQNFGSKLLSKSALDSCIGKPVSSIAAIIKMEKITDDSARKAVYPFVDYIVEPNVVHYISNRFMANSIFLSVNDQDMITALSIYLDADGDSVYAALSEIYGPADFRGSLNAAEAFGTGDNMVNYLWKVDRKCFSFKKIPHMGFIRLL